MQRSIQRNAYMKTHHLPLFVLVAALSARHVNAADAQLDSWLTTYSGQYARLYATDADKASGNAVTTWSRGTLTQSTPAYAGVHEIDYSATSVYIRSSGLGAHIMGPWYLNSGHTMTFPNLPINAKSIL